MLFEGARGPVDYDAAYKLYVEAAETNYSPAVYMVGYCLLYGYGVASDPKAAIVYYKRATEMNYVTAQYALALCYETANGVDLDYAEAVRLYELAIAQNDGSSMNNLANLYYEGRGRPLDYDKAFALYSQAAERKVPSSVYMIGICHELGRGVPHADYAEAAKWLHRAADLHYATAAVRLATFYMNGLVPPPSPHEHLRLSYQAAQLGDAAGMAAVGRALEPIHLAKAVDWYSAALARDNNGSQAAQALHRIGFDYAMPLPLPL